MPQPPFFADAIQIEPGSGDVLTIGRFASDGSMQFKDPLHASGLALKDLAGLRNVNNVMVVGIAGGGAQYTSIQAALDDVPSSSSAANPYLILVLPGVYNETITIHRDGVHLVGIGFPTLNPLETTPNGPGADHTVIIEAGDGTIPTTGVLQNLIITNSHDNMAAVRFIGGAASEVATSGFVLNDLLVTSESANGNYSLWAMSVGTLLVTNALLLGAKSLFKVDECLELSATNSAMKAVDLAWTAAGDHAVGSATNLTFKGCDLGDSVLAIPVGVSIEAGGPNVRFRHSTIEGDVTLSGESDVGLHYCIFEGANLVANDSVVAEVLGASPASITTGGVSTVATESLTGTATFTAETSKAVVLPHVWPDDAYTVFLEMPAHSANDEVAYITGKGGTGFTINFATNQTLVVSWEARRRT